MGDSVVLDVSKLSDHVEELRRKLSSKVIGQDRAINRIVKAYVPTTVKMHREHRPLGVFLFLGPTGVGKSEMVKAFADFFFHNRNALTKIDCTEYQHSHEVAKLIGSPPGYLGYSDEPRLSQAQIDKYQTKEHPVNIVLFDEIEKAHDRFFEGILNILGDGELTLGNGKAVDFSKSFIFMTSNLGSEETRKMIEGSGVGFKSTAVDREHLDDKIYRASKEALKRAFRPEFLNRLDSVVVFRSLSADTLRRILVKELVALQWRIWQSPWRDFKFEKDAIKPPGLHISFNTTQSADEFLLREGTSELYGARELNRAVDRYIGYPLAALISSGQLATRDKLDIDYVEGDRGLTFRKLAPDEKLPVVIL